MISDTKSILFYGDSLTSGENNNFKSFVDKINLNNVICKKYGVSGTTFGNYSIYPVGNNTSCIESLYKTDTSILANADIIFIEYGVNDTTSVCLNYVSLQQVLLDFKKCLDYIKQLSSAKIIFLNLGDINTITKMAQLQKNYIISDYLNDKFNFNIDNWLNIYSDINNFACTFCDDVWPLFDNCTDYIEHIDQDNMHPNNLGYSIIANNLLNRLKTIIQK